MNKKNLKKIINVIISLTFLVMLGVTAFSETYDEISENARNSFVSNEFNKMLIQDHNYGLSSAYGTDDITLGEGFLYHTLSWDYVKENEKKNKTSETDELFSAEGYLFLIKAKGENIAIAFADLTGEVYKISNDLNFEQNLSNALIEQETLQKGKISKSTDLNILKAKIKSSPITTSSEDVKIIYDEQIGLGGLVVNTADGDKIIPMWEDSDGQKKIENIDEYVEKLTDSLKNKKNGELLAGGFSLDDANNVVKRYQRENIKQQVSLTFGCICLIALGIYIPIRRRKKFEN